MRMHTSEHPGETSLSTEGKCSQLPPVKVPIICIFQRCLAIFRLKGEISGDIREEHSVGNSKLCFKRVIKKNNLSQVFKPALICMSTLKHINEISQKTEAEAPKNQLEANWATGTRSPCVPS